MNFQILSISLAIVLAVSACNNVKKEDPDSAIALRLSPQTISLGEHTLTLEAFLWRDFMPMTPPGGSELRSVVKVSKQGIGDLDITPELLYQYVIYGDEVWKAAIESVHHYPDRIEGFSGGGPKWGPDVLVDVVVELKYDGNTYRVLAKDQGITATH